MVCLGQSESRLDHRRGESSQAEFDPYRQTLVGCHEYARWSLSNKGGARHAVMP